jgi:hypothetical protein
MKCPKCGWFLLGASDDDRHCGNVNCPDGYDIRRYPPYAQDRRYLVEVKQLDNGYVVRRYLSWRDTTCA